MLYGTHTPPFGVQEQREQSGPTEQPNWEAVEWIFRTGSQCGSGTHARLPVLEINTYMIYVWIVLPGGCGLFGRAQPER